MGAVITLTSNPTTKQQTHYLTLCICVVLVWDTIEIGKLVLREEAAGIQRPSAQMHVRSCMHEYMAHLLAHGTTFVCGRIEIHFLGDELL